MTTPFFHKRDAKITLNSVNSGSLQYSCASSSDYDLYALGDPISITDHVGNLVLDGYIVDKTRTNVALTTLYIEDAGKFLRDFNVEDNAPEDGDPVCDTVRHIIQQYILPASWSLDTSAFSNVYDDVEARLEWPIRYALRNGTALKHINILCDMMGMRWVADWKENTSTFSLKLYPVDFVPTSSWLSVATPASISELVNTSQFTAGETGRNFVTCLQVVGGEPETGQTTSYIQKDYRDGYRFNPDTAVAYNYGYLDSTDTYCKTLELSPGTTVADVFDSAMMTGWATMTGTLSHLPCFQFNHDENYYVYTSFDGVSVRGVSGMSLAPWKVIDPATVTTVGLTLSHATNDEMFLCGALLVDRILDFAHGATIGATTWAWLGSEVISFETASYWDAGTPIGMQTLLNSVTRGLNGVRYVHRKGTLIRPYYSHETGTTVASETAFYSVGTLSVSVSVPGFTEQDGLDKLAAGMLNAATFTYSGKTERLVATLASADLYPGMWVQTRPASFNQTTVASLTPDITMIKSVSYSLGKLVAIEFGTNIPTTIRNSKESVTALDLSMQKPQQSQPGEVIEVSPNKTSALMKIAKTSKERIKSVDAFTDSEETNYVSRWVRIK